MDNTETPDNFIMFFAVWDEKLGPKVLERYPSKCSIDIDETSVQIFMSFQTIFGNSREVRFDRTKLVLPLKSLKRVAKILLDSTTNPSIRGGFLPFVVVFLLPLDFPEEQLTIYNVVQTQIVEHYLQNNKIKLTDYLSQTQIETDKLGQQLNQQAFKSMKEKNFVKAIELFSQSVAIMRITENFQKIRKYRNDLNNARAKRVTELLSMGQKAQREKIWEDSIKYIENALKLAEEAQNDSLVKKCHQNLDAGLAMWARPYYENSLKLYASKQYEAAIQNLSQGFDIISRTESKKTRIPYEKLQSSAYSDWAIQIRSETLQQVKEKHLHRANEMMLDAIEKAKLGKNLKLRNKLEKDLAKLPNP